MSEIRPAVGLVLLILSSPVVAPAAVSLDIEPAWPTRFDPIEIRIEFRDYPACHAPELRIDGKTIAIIIPCDGPIHVIGRANEPLTATFRLDPLPAGVYAVQVATDRPLGPANIRQTLAGRPLTVTDNTFNVVGVAVDPSSPSADDLVVWLEVGTICPAAFAFAGVAGKTVLIYGGGTPGCVTLPVVPPVIYTERIDLGQLPAGDYTALFLADDDATRPEGTLLAAHAFRVAPAFDVSVRLGPDGRFSTAATWTKPDGTSDLAFGRLLPESDDSATFWFFRPGNRELMIKVLDGCSANGHYWVFVGGLTNLGVELIVSDIEGEREVAYSNPLGTDFEPILDTHAFACDP